MSMNIVIGLAIVSCGLAVVVILLCICQVVQLWYNRKITQKWKTTYNMMKDLNKSLAMPQAVSEFDRNLKKMPKQQVTGMEDTKDNECILNELYVTVEHSRNEIENRGVQYDYVSIIS